MTRNQHASATGFALSALTIVSAIVLVLSLSIVFAGCKTGTGPNGTTTPIATLGNCIDAEGKAIASGKSVLDIAEAVASAIALGVTGGGFPAVEAAIETLIAQFGEPIVACAVLEGAAPAATTPGVGSAAGSGSGSGSSAVTPLGAARLITTPLTDPRTVRRLLAQIHGWKETP